MTDVEAPDGEVGPTLEPAPPSPDPEKGRAAKVKKEPPDPVIGIGLVVLGVLIMGIGGAATLHYVFNAGTAITIVGALVFVISVAMSSLGDRKLRPQ